MTAQKIRKVLEAKKLNMSRGGFIWLTTIESKSIKVTKNRKILLKYYFKPTLKRKRVKKIGHYIII